MTLPADADIPLILSRIRPGVSYGWKGDGSSWSNPKDVDWYGSSDPPTLSELESEWSAIVAAENLKTTVRSQLKSDYAPIVGRAISSLTNSEQRTLLEILCYVMGGIDNSSRTFLPLNQWTTAKELLK